METTNEKRHDKNRAIFVLLPESFGLRLAPSALNSMRFSEVPYLFGLARRRHSERIHGSYEIFIELV